MKRAALLLFVALPACSDPPVVAGLDETEANRVVVALDRAGVPSSKEIDPGFSADENGPAFAQENGPGVIDRVAITIVG
jgi:type III secretory pathway lipoprotein EscJ